MKIPNPEIAFDGETYDPDRDYVRLSGQLKRVYEFMSDHKWHTLQEIADACYGTEAAVSARLRDLRKQKYGSHVVEKEHVFNGLYQYRLVRETQ